MALAIAIALSALVAGPAQAMPERERALAPTVAVTTGLLRFNGDGYIADWLEHSLTAGPNVAFTMSGQGSRVEFNVSSGFQFWHLALKAPNGNDLAVGDYFDATREPFSAPGEPGFTLSGDGRGCNIERSEFTVRRITLDTDHVIQAIDATFFQQCENARSFTRGDVVVNFDPVPAPPAAPAALAMVGGDANHPNGRYSFATTSGNGVLAHAKRGGNAIVVAAFGTPLGDWWDLEAAAPTGQVLTAGHTYSATTQQAGAGQPGLAVTSAQYLPCDTEVGSFTVNQLHTAWDGSIDLLDLSFQRTCDGTIPATGRVLVNRTLPPLVTTIAVAPTGAVQVLKVTMILTVSGTVTCSQPATYTVTGTVSQTIFGTPIPHPFTARADCATGTGTWTAAVGVSLTRGFVPGPASVTATATVDNEIRYAPPFPLPAGASATVQVHRVLNPRRLFV